MFRFLGVSFATLVRLFCSQKSLLLENLVLRQQLSVLERRHPRPRLELLERLFWVIVRRCWSGWKQALLVVTPETVVRKHGAGFRWYWMLISKVRKPVGMKTHISRSSRSDLPNGDRQPYLGSSAHPRQLLMVGFDVSERTISRWMKRTRRNPDPAKRWITFLRNHKEAMVAMGFFTVLTVSFGLLYCFFIISHDRRRILHFNVTKHPTTQVDHPTVAQGVSF